MLFLSAALDVLKTTRNIMEEDGNMSHVIIIDGISCDIGRLCCLNWLNRECSPILNLEEAFTS